MSLQLDSECSELERLCRQATSYASTRFSWVLDQNYPFGTFGALEFIHETHEFMYEKII